MEKLPAEIIIVENKEQMQNNIDSVPAYKEITDGFTLTTIDDLKKANKQSLLDNILRLFGRKVNEIQVYNGDSLTPIEKYSKKGHLVQSLIYNNLYYPLFGYANFSYEELVRVMATLAHFMGDNVQFDYQYFQETLKDFEIKDNKGAWAEIDVSTESQKINEKLGGETSKNEGEKQEKTIKRNIETKVSNFRKSPKKLRKYIKDNNINIEALPDSFKAMLDTYLENPNGKLYSYKDEVYTLEKAEKYTQICHKFAINTNIVDKLIAKFDINISKETIDKIKVRTKIKHSITFN